MQKDVFTPTECAALITCASDFQADKDSEKFLSRLRAIVLKKMAQMSEQERLISLKP